ncbi:MAG: hypothetical protein M1836_004042 [Candelina mexicana]|nr:MAG: hypothetical protein M1836_004042 [Candelina mexicana]
MNVIMNETLSVSKSKRTSKSVKPKQKEKMKKKNMSLMLQQLFFKNLLIRANDKKSKDEKKKTVTVNEINAAEVDNNDENEQEAELYNLFSVSASRLCVKLHRKKISALLNLRAEINIMIKTLVNSLRLSIQTEVMIKLISYQDETTHFVNVIMKTEMICDDMFTQTLIFIIKNTDHELVLERLYQLVADTEISDSKNDACSVKIYLMN